MTAPLLVAEGLGKDFGGLRAVDGVHLTVDPREVVGIIGPNGAGKTTVFNLLSGVTRPTRGRIRIGEQDLTGRPAYEYARHGVARTFQNIRLFRGMSVLDNVLCGMHFRLEAGLWQHLWRGAAYRRKLDAAREEALGLLRDFGLADAAGLPAGSLPYGLQRRLEIVRALATRPRLLLLDEPAAGMNPMEAEELMRLVRRVWREFGVAIVLIEHHMDVVMNLCQRVVVMHHGVAIAVGSPETVQNDPEVIEVYLGRDAADAGG